MVTITENATRIMVKQIYLPNSGSARDVDGIVSISTNRKKVRDKNIDVDRAT